jgi:hypothetical protein
LRCPDACLLRAEARWGKAADISPDLERRSALDSRSRGSLRSRGAMPRFAARLLLLVEPRGSFGGCMLRWRLGGAWRTDPPRLCRTPPSRGNASVWRKEQVVSLAARTIRAAAGLDEPATTSDRAVVNDGVVNSAFPWHLRRRSDRQAGLRGDRWRFRWLDAHRSGISLRMLTPGSFFSSPVCLRFAPEDAVLGVGPGWDHQS